MQLRLDDLLQHAEAVTGLHDWGAEEYFDTEFRGLLAAMLHSLEHESALTDQGRHGAELRLTAALEGRLRFIADRARWPGIRHEQIVRPLFILGLPRSGSTFLHTLMAQDPGNRVPLTWEMMLPSPPPTPADGQTDSRVARSESILTAMGLLHPDILALHRFGARQPEECHLLMELMLLGDNLPACWRMPTFNKQRAATDLLLGYRTHRMVLQNLQFRHRGERVLLKNPGHVFYLPLLLSVYPDALLVLTHRDPTKVIPSVAALLVAMRKASSSDVAPADKIAMGNLRAFAEGLTRTIQFRQRPGMNERFCDVHFLHLICDPIGTVERIYAHFGIVLREDARRAMQRWLDDPANRTPKGRHALADCGLDAAKVDLAFGDYMAHYAVARER